MNKKVYNDSKIIRKVSDMKRPTAVLLLLPLLLSLCACGTSASGLGPTAEAAPSPAADPAEFPPRSIAEEDYDAVSSGEPSGDPSGDPTGELMPEPYPAEGYDKTFAGYQAYAIDALLQDELAPEDIREATVADIEAAVNGYDSCFSLLIWQGLILSYDAFME